MLESIGQASSSSVIFDNQSDGEQDSVEIDSRLILELRESQEFEKSPANKHIQRNQTLISNKTTIFSPLRAKDSNDRMLKDKVELKEAEEV